MLRRLVAGGKQCQPYVIRISYQPQQQQQLAACVAADRPHRYAA